MTVSTFPIQIDVTIPDPAERHSGPVSASTWRRVMVTLAVLSAALWRAGIRSAVAAPSAVVGARSTILVSLGLACFPLGVLELLGRGPALLVAGLCLFAADFLLRTDDE